jgi:hypothetical protein
LVKRPSSRKTASPASDANDSWLKIARTVYDALVAQDPGPQITLRDGGASSGAPLNTHSEPSNVPRHHTALRTTAAIRVRSRQDDRSPIK